MAAGAGLDDRLSPFIAGYVLILAVLAPLAVGRSYWLARILPGRSGGGEGGTGGPAALTPDGTAAAVPDRR